jgi:hypothetical protein
MPGYHVFIDDVADARMQHAAREMGLKVEDLIEIAAEEAALEYAKSRGLLVPVPDTPRHGEK